MTTIVYDHKRKQIAIDSRYTSGGVIISDGGVKFKTKDNKTWFFCGKACDSELLMDMPHNDKPEVAPDCAALFVEDGTVYSVSASSDGFIEHDKQEFNASAGSGRDFALAALDFGKTAEEAVDYAMTRDCYTGGKIHVYDIDRGEFL